MAEAEAFAKRLQSGWDTARKIIGAAQERKARFANRTRREPDFGKGDKVWLSTKHLALGRPSRKLAKLNDGPYTILEQKGHSYLLDLPEHMKIHPVIHARFLRKDPDDPLPGQINPPPTPLVVDGEKEWEVESLLAVRKRYGKLVYRVKWLGADEDPEEYPAGNFKYSPHLLRDFHLAHPDLPGPPENLDRWIKAWESGVDSYEELEGRKDGGVPMDESSRASFFRRGGGDETLQTLRRFGLLRPSQEARKSCPNRD